MALRNAVWVAAGVFLLVVIPSYADPPPAGYQIHCRKSRCPTGGAPSVKLTPARKAELTAVNRLINRRIEYVPDAGDVWELGVTKGDCEDYALAKQHALIDRGWPPAALRLAEVETARKRLHIVLVVKTDAGDLTLDNRRSAILPLQETGYRLRKIATTNPAVWWSPRDEMAYAAPGPSCG